MKHLLNLTQRCRLSPFQRKMNVDTAEVFPLKRNIRHAMQQQINVILSIDYTLNSLQILVKF